MRIALVSDIHANLAALEAVMLHVESSAPDQVLVGGDTINRGPQPHACLQAIRSRVRDHGWKIIRGNHEDYVLRVASGIDHLPEWERKVMSHTVWTEALVRDDLEEIAAWPGELEVAAPDGSTIVLTHASRKGNRVGIYASMTDEVIIDHAHPHAGVFCVGHTHIPFIRRIDERLFVNSGAVGMPFDGDHRASYALLEWSADGWSAEIIRVPYDRMATARAFDETGYREHGGPMVPIIYWEFQHARPALGLWHQRFEKDVSEGRITLEDSVRMMIENPQAAL